MITKSIIKRSFCLKVAFLLLLSVILFSKILNDVSASDFFVIPKSELSQSMQLNSLIYDIPMIGSGTQEDPYIITSKYQLSAKSTYSIYNDLSAHYKLGTDIVFTEDDYAEGGYFHYYGTIPQPGVSSVYGLGFEPIGGWPDPFTGVFDGDNHSITGLYTEYDGTFRNIIGLFGHVENGTVKNLNLVDVNISTASTVEMFTAGVVGHLENGMVINCTVSGTVAGDSIVGGIVGEVNSEGVVEACTNNANVVGTASPFLSVNDEYSEVLLKVGGIVGSNVNAMVDSCSNAGLIKAEAAGGLHTSLGAAGGIAGYVEEGTVINSTNKSDIAATDQSMTSYPLYVLLSAGGIVGRGDVPTITGCTNSAEVLAYNSSGSVTSCYAGGIIGADVTSDYGTGGYISDCTNTGNVGGTARDGAIALVGGIAGGADSYIENCKNEGEVLGYTRDSDNLIHGYSGGIAGFSSASVNSCYNVGEVYNWGYARVANEDVLFQMELRTGGIVGYLLNGIVSNTYNTGNITVGNYQPDTVEQDESQVFTGGIVGFLVNSSVYSCYNRGSIDSTNPSGRMGGGVGAVVGNDGSPYVESIYTSTNNNIVATIINNTNSLSFNDYDYRLTDAEMEQKSLFVGFLFGDIWIYDTASAYLYPELVSFTDYTAEPESYIISGIQVLGTKIPTKGSTPAIASDTTLPIGAKYTVTDITWHDNPTVFYGDTVYSADITLSTNSNFVFDNEVSFLVSGTTDVTQKSLSTDGKVLVLSVTYRRLSAAVLQKISVESVSKNIYYVDETFEQERIVVKGWYDDNTSRILNSSEYYFEQTNFDLPENVGDEGYTHTIVCLAASVAGHQDLFNVRVIKRPITADDFTMVPSANLMENGQPKEATIIIENEVISSNNPTQTVFYSNKKDPNFGLEPVPTDAPTTAGDYYVYIAVIMSDESIYNSVSPDAPLYLGSFTVFGSIYDVNNDSKVNILDLQEIVKVGNYNKLVGEPGVNSDTDVNNDGKVNFLDLANVRNSEIFAKTGE